MCFDEMGTSANLECGHYYDFEKNVCTSVHKIDVVKRTHIHDGCFRCTPTVRNWVITKLRYWLCL